MDHNDHSPFTFSSTRSRNCLSLGPVSSVRRPSGGCSDNGRDTPRPLRPTYLPAFLSLFSLRFSFVVSLAFCCCSLLPLSFFPLSAISVPPSPSCIQLLILRRLPFAGRALAPAGNRTPACRPRQALLGGMLTGNGLAATCGSRKPHPPANGAAEAGD